MSFDECITAERVVLESVPDDIGRSDDVRSRVGRLHDSRKPTGSVPPKLEATLTSLLRRDTRNRLVETRHRHAQLTDDHDIVGNHAPLVEIEPLIGLQAPLQHENDV